MQNNFSIGITTIIYGTYGKFLQQWINSINALKTKPTQVTIVFGKGAEVPTGVGWLPNIKIVESDSDNMGVLKNLAIENTPTEWVMAIGVDDNVLPWAIDEFSKYQDADIIVSPYIYIAPKSRCMHPQISKETLLSRDYYINGTNYMHGGIPFKRKLWEKYGFQNNECYNSLFWIDCTKSNPKFAHPPIPCITYNHWKGSHSNKIDLQTRQKRFKIIDEYRQNA